MGISSAIQWWDEWQLRILALSSLLVQYILLVMAPRRKFPMKFYLRYIIWLAYLSSDALAIYALATLFNRHKKQDYGHAHNTSILEVLWAPIFLIHLAGQDSITAYNIEDNELWTRHALTSLSQITIAIYVFCKSWPGGDRRLLQAAILLFVPGVLKCLEKPWALSSASINSLVSSPKNVRRTTNREVKKDPIQDFIDKVNESRLEDGRWEESSSPADFKPSELFVDLASPSSDDRLSKLLSFLQREGDESYILLQKSLYETFDLLYTKEKMFPIILSALKRQQNYVNTNVDTDEGKKEQETLKGFCGSMLRGLLPYLSFVAIGLFHQSHRKAYNHTDVKVTYTLLCCTAVLELYGPTLQKILTSGQARVQKTSFNMNSPKSVGKVNHAKHDVQAKSKAKGKLPVYDIMDDMVSQYSLLGYFVRNRKHSVIMGVAEFLSCKDYLDQRWRMKSCSSSRNITNLVLGHVKRWWNDEITNVSCYRKFNDNRGQWTLESEVFLQQLGWSLEGAFDESVLLWHLATDFCYYHICGSHDCEHATKTCFQGTSDLKSESPTFCEESIHQGRAVHCREMSNYMMYLLVVNPEMLMAGSRRNLFTDAYNQLKGMFNKKSTPLNEGELAGTIISEVQVHVQQPIKEKTIEDKTPAPSNKTGLIDDAWSIAEVLLNLHDEEKMWRVIEGVWVEMLCFSAARCRGYLHAKSLGTGVQFLSYVWLLMHYMGMETLAEKLARAELPNGACSGDSRTTHAEHSSGKEQVAGASSNDGITVVVDKNG
ncbi:hypothetical protein DAI22_07g096900 [Oryza sativa Japonica Group]|jgi:hypothetical protein|nr:hypothetical protein DAI22_07g096900 [Oryza sativa Japonica Group]